MLTAMITPSSLKIKLQLYCGHEIATGPEKADLLDAIMREGSISAAGRALGMSYRPTWLLVNTMNRCWRDRLVETVAGGSGGARVTPLGITVLTRYRALQKRVSTSTKCDALIGLEAAMLPQPRNSQTS